LTTEVELISKWIKQHLEIKPFWGTTENAVGIQVYSALIALLPHNSRHRIKNKPLNLRSFTIVENFSTR